MAIRPGPRELEVSVFGRGRGEALVVHLGDDRWVTVDSFVDPDSRLPVGLAYLQSIGVDASAIGFVVATHWDQDHISGITRLAADATDAQIVLSTAVGSENFLRMAFRHQQRTHSGPLGSGTKEFVSLIEMLERADRTPRLVDQDTTLYERGGVRLVALSPSPAVSLDALTAPSIAVLAAASPGDSVREPTPNAGSVALALRFPGADVVLGADLEQAGWSAAMNAQTARDMSAVAFKVPHHGSPDADLPGLWDAWMRDDLAYAVTRFNNGARSRPSDSDRTRLRERRPNGHVVGAAPMRSRLHGVVGRRVNAATRDGIWRVTGPVGQHRWRHDLDSLHGDLVAVTGVVEAV